MVKPINKLSPINNYIKKNKSIVYHVCYEIKNDNCIEKLFEGNRILWESKVQPAKLFNNRLVSFHFLHNVGLIEILRCDI